MCSRPSDLARFPGLVDTILSCFLLDKIMDGGESSISKPWIQKGGISGILNKRLLVLFPSKVHFKIWRTLDFQCCKSRFLEVRCFEIPNVLYIISRNIQVRQLGHGLLHKLLSIYLQRVFRSSCLVAQPFRVRPLSSSALVNPNSFLLSG